MRQLIRSLSAMTVLYTFSAYLLARLRSNPSLVAIAAFAQEAHNALYTALQTFLSARTETMAAAAVRDTKRFGLDVAYRSLRGAVLSLVRNDRCSKLYKAIFHDGFSAVLRGSPEEELGQAQKTLRWLAELQNPALAAATEGLQLATDDLDTALTGYQDAEKAEESAATALNIAKEVYCTKYEQVYGKLLDTLGERRLADSYFRPTAVPSKPQPEPVPQPQPVPAPAPSTLAVVAHPASSEASPEAPDSAAAIVAGDEVVTNAA